MGHDRGKSSLAVRWAAERSKSVCYVATATASDDEMATRIDAHRRERPEHWRVREEPRKLSAALRDESRTGGLLLIDCLTLWTANCLWPPEKLSEVEPQPDLAGWHAERDAFLTSVLTTPNEVIIVSNEVGTSLVPENAGARLFRDEQGASINSSLLPATPSFWLQQACHCA